MNREISYEQAISELEQIVEKLNSGCVALDEMVTLYEQGVELADYCKELLVRYEGRMDKAIRRDGSADQGEIF
ncbi:MAG: exodeoxyribonuclease VII small subunit [Christensenellaceae bacterium]|nr:exodeoxyribonuclease VII small subunit [Christensenellaceae bacterium]